MSIYACKLQNCRRKGAARRRASPRTARNRRASAGRPSCMVWRVSLTTSWRKAVNSQGCSVAKDSSREKNVTRRLFTEERRCTCSIPISAYSLSTGAPCRFYGVSIRIAPRPFAIANFDLEAAECCGRLREQLNRKGQPIGPYDLLIASQALARNMTLVTNNQKEFRRIDQLKLEDWLTG